MRFNGMIHGFLSMVGIIHRAGMAMDKITAEVRRVLNG